MAMLRLPTRRSGGRANLHQGAIGAGVDLVSGITTRAVFCNRLAERHPDTGEPVVGIQVPRWTEVLDIARRVSQAVGLGYLGVDIVIDGRRGPLLLEANARPGLAIQIANGIGLLPRFDEIDQNLAESSRGEP
jgi:alpha-L-glutamate ligase-like protein